MSTSTASGGGGGVGGALSLMGCVREASPPPQDHHHHHHHHHHRTFALGEFPTQHSVDPLPKESKKRRFHPLRGLRKIFRRKSRGAADVRLVPNTGERDAELAHRLPREDVTMRHPAGRAEEVRSKSASELLTDSCDRESVFLRRDCMEDTMFVKLRGGAGKLSVSHDSVFPGEVPHTRPLSSLANLATLEHRKQARKSNEIEHKDYNHHPVAQRHRISLRVLEQIKTVIENRNQLASATSTDSPNTVHAVGERYQQETTENRFAVFEKHDRSTEENQVKGKFEYQPIVSIGSFKDENQVRLTTATRKIHQRDQRTIKREQIRIDFAATIEDKITDPPLSSSSTSSNNGPSYKSRPRSKQSDTANRILRVVKEEQIRVEDTTEITKLTKDTADQNIPVPKEDLPQLESASLNHTAAHHRISVRPKNRRPPRRTASTTINAVSADSNTSLSIPTITEDTLDSLEHLQQQLIVTSNASSPTEPKSVSVTRKSSSRLSRNSDIFEELESRLPRKPSATSLSPDSLDVTTSSRSSAEMPSDEQTTEIRSVVRRPSNRMSKGSDVMEELEAKLPRRRSSSNRLSKSPDSLDSASCWFSKSTEGFDKLIEYEETKPTVSRRLLNPISKSTDRVFKSSDSLEAIEPIASDDSVECRRSSFDFRARRSSKAISKSSESFDMLEQNQYIDEDVRQEWQKRNSASDVSLSRGRRLSKNNISKSSENFDKIDMSETRDVEANILEDTPRSRRSSKRMSSESSENFDVEDRLENRRIRRIPKRVQSTGIVDVVSMEDHDAAGRPTPIRKPSRLQKSSESSELGSTDTLDSERRNKSSESTETLDSLEKDLEQDKKEEEITDSADRREKNNSWSNRNITATDSDQTSIGDDTEDSKSLISSDKYYWRQSTEPKENLGIHQLVAITIVTRMADNGNNQRSSVIYPKKKQQMSTSQPTSPVAKQEGTKMLFDNLLVSKNDEDLQNMLNGNISEVSTDTKSFKEKLIMFEKLGK